MCTEHRPTMEAAGRRQPDRRSSQWRPTNPGDPLNAHWPHSPLTKHDKHICRAKWPVKRYKAKPTHCGSSIIIAQADQDKGHVAASVGQPSAGIWQGFFVIPSDIYYYFFLYKGLPCKRNASADVWAPRCKIGPLLYIQKIHIFNDSTYSIACRT